ncbi:uncharacterized protein BJ171DRAFT_564517 [Polychytrium aggregatum]|uniref:uncharacterized protein n=1 Tax=Polychytrium aggregatum TaxID=110093 RepID=UPI0022FED01A|nr:uncharacterized protein BJ171DRAFT_564517 [Polychytrium aggregatum]KAI9209304.1 hypothetical protein BJ171DRAFT_564517 [Polychytrium aggregatum]
MPQFQTTRCAFVSSENKRRCAGTALATGKLCNAHSGQSIDGRCPYGTDVSNFTKQCKWGCMKGWDGCRYHGKEIIRGLTVMREARCPYKTKKSGFREQCRLYCVDGFDGCEWHGTRIQVHHLPRIRHGSSAAMQVVPFSDDDDVDDNDSQTDEDEGLQASNPQGGNGQDMTEMVQLFQQLLQMTQASELSAATLNKELKKIVGNARASDSSASFSGGSKRKSTRD